MSDQPQVSLPLRPFDSISKPTFSLPAGAWDTHIHVFGPADRYPHVPKPHYTLPDGTLAQYLRLMPVLGIAHFVIVQPSFYGPDNSCLIDALEQVGAIARGVVMFEPDIEDQQLEEFHRHGVRAVRLDLFKRAGEPRAALQRYIQAMAARVGPLGWHLQFYAPGYVVRDLIGFLGTLQIDFVIDHMGYMLEEDGLNKSDFLALLDLLDKGRCYLKLSGAYRIAKQRSLDYVEPVAKAIVERAPERAIFGSDWPHISFSHLDSGALVSLLERWAPSAAVRQKILVENPNRLFRVS